MRTCSSAACAAADGGSRNRSSSERAWADAKTAVGGGGSFGKDAYQLSIGLFHEGASAEFAHVGTHTSSSAMSYARHQNTQFSKQELDFRELVRPFETAPKTTRVSTSTKSRRACTPPRVTRLRRPIRLSSSERLMCLLFEKNGTKTKWPGST